MGGSGGPFGSSPGSLEGLPLGSVRLLRISIAEPFCERPKSRGEACVAKENEGSKCTQSEVSQSSSQCVAGQVQAVLCALGCLSVGAETPYLICRGSKTSHTYSAGLNHCFAESVSTTKNVGFYIFCIVLFCF